MANRKLVHLTVVLAGLVLGAWDLQADQAVERELAAAKARLERQLSAAMPESIRKDAQLDGSLDWIKDWLEKLAELDKKAAAASVPKTAHAWTVEYAQQLRALSSAIEQLERVGEVVAMLKKRIADLEREAPQKLQAATEKCIAKKDPKFNEVTFDGLQAEHEKRRTEDRELWKKAHRYLLDARSFKGTGAFSPSAAAVETRGNETLDAGVREITRAYNSLPVKTCLAGRNSDYYKRFTTDIFADPKDMALLNFMSIPIDPDWLDVQAHGSPDSLEVRGAGGTESADYKAIFKILKVQLGPEKYKQWKTLHQQTGKGGVRLLSCESGAKGPGVARPGIAQGLATRLGVPVKAPTDTLWAIRVAGSIRMRIHSCDDCKPGKPIRAGHVRFAPETGQWQIFRPQDNSAAEKLRDYLWEITKKDTSWKVYVSRAKPFVLEPKNTASVVTAIKGVAPDLDSPAILKNLKAAVAGEVEWTIARGLRWDDAWRIQHHVRPHGIITFCRNPLIGDKRFTSTERPKDD